MTPSARTSAGPRTCTSTGTGPGSRAGAGSAHFDVVVLGAGSGGYTAAIRCAQLGLRTAIVERDAWGGVCLNIGCIPTKALLRNAELSDLLRHHTHRFGITTPGPIDMDYQVAYQRSRRVVEQRVRGLRFLLRKNAIADFHAHGTFDGAHTLRLTPSGDFPDGAAPPDVLTFEHCIIDVGATPRMLPGTEASQRVVTYAEQIMATSAPSSIVVIGGGAIGVEFAYLLRSYGTEVTMFEVADRLLPAEDDDIGTELTKQFRRAGITVHTGARNVHVRDEPTADAVDVTTTAAGQNITVRAERALMAVGFAPRTSGYGLESTGVELDGRGAIAVDERCRTNVPGIYAIGDVTARLMLAHVADTMGIVAAETIAGAETMPLPDRAYTMMPRATFCFPQVASFGFTEQQARDAGLDVAVSRFPFSANGKAPAIGDTVGFVKLIATTEHAELVGAHLIGPDVAELLPELTLAAMWDLTAHEVARNVHAHPTLGEAIKEAVHGLTGHMINF